MHRIKPPLCIQSEYERWCYFIKNKITFNLEFSECHTHEHEARVLLYALLIADKLDVSNEEKEILCHAACFHDTRREDDWYDIGHGLRAAEYYKEYCENNGLHCYQWCYNIMAYHDRDDNIGEQIMSSDATGREVLLYRIFKDADALDRFRLGPNGLDVKYLRTQAARELYAYAKETWELFAD